MLDLPTLLAQVYFFFCELVEVSTPHVKLAWVWWYMAEFQVKSNHQHDMFWTTQRLAEEFKEYLNWFVATCAFHLQLKLENDNL